MLYIKDCVWYVQFMWVLGLEGKGVQMGPQGASGASLWQGSFITRLINDAELSVLNHLRHCLELVKRNAKE